MLGALLCNLPRGIGGDVASAKHAARGLRDELKRKRRQVLEAIAEVKRDVVVVQEKVESPVLDWAEDRLQALRQQVLSANIELLERILVETQAIAAEVDDEEAFLMLL